MGGNIGKISAGVVAKGKHEAAITKLEGEIARGVKDGTLTGPESKKLYTELASLKEQFKKTMFQPSGFGGNQAAQLSQLSLSANEAFLSKKIDGERSNGQVDARKFFHSNIGQMGQQIQGLERNINQGTASGALTPKETKFLKTELEALKTAFTNAIKGDGKLDETEQKQLNELKNKLGADAFELSNNSRHRYGK